AERGGRRDVGAQRLGRVLAQDIEEVVVADLEDLRGVLHAQRVALAQGEVDHDAHQKLLRGHDRAAADEVARGAAPRLIARRSVAAEQSPSMARDELSTLQPTDAQRYAASPGRRGAPGWWGKRGGVASQDRGSGFEDARSAARCRRAADAGGGLRRGELAARRQRSRLKAAARALLLPHDGRPLPRRLPPPRRAEPRAPRARARLGP